MSAANTRSAVKLDAADVKIEVGDLARSFSVTCPEQTPIIEGLLNRGEIAILAARPNTGKTPLVTQLASCAAAGAPFLGMPTRRSRVLLIDSESQPEVYRDVMRRQWRGLSLDEAAVTGGINLFCRGVPGDPNSDELERIMRERNETRYEWLDNLVRDGKYDLVVVDTILSFCPFKAGDEDKVREYFASIGAFCRSGRGPACLGTVHLRKIDRRARTPSLIEDPHGFTEEILGSVVWSSNADVRLGLERLEDDRLALAGFRRAIGEIPPMILDKLLDEEGEVLALRLADSDDVAATVLTEDQASNFKLLPVGRDMRWAEILALGIPKSSLHRLLQRAVKAGLARHDLDRRVWCRLR